MPTAPSALWVQLERNAIQCYASRGSMRMPPSEVVELSSAWKEGDFYSVRIAGGTDLILPHNVLAFCM